MTGVPSPLGDPSPDAVVEERYGPARPPGSLTVSPDAHPSSITVMRYDAQSLEESTTEPGGLGALRNRGGVTWVNVTGLGTLDTIREVGRVFDLHPLALEDVLNLQQRPKCEDYDSVLFFVTRMMEQGDRVQSEQVALFLGKGFVITLQEREGDCFEPVRNRIRSGRRRIRSSGPDYLAYALLDAAIDGYFPVLEAYADRLDRLEEQVARHPDDELIGDLQTVKHDLRRIRRAIWPQREAISKVLTDDHELLTAETRLFFRDSHDHALRIMDLVESYQDWSVDVTNYFMSAVSNRMNHVMRVLTVVAALFIPLTFVAGIYGMNFDPGVSSANMPELGWRWGYPAVMLFMAVIAGVQLWAFRRRGWLGSARQRRSESP